MTNIVFKFSKSALYFIPTFDFMLDNIVSELKPHELL